MDAQVDELASVVVDVGPFRYIEDSVGGYSVVCGR